jgi:hypothetical protein
LALTILETQDMRRTTDYSKLNAEPDALLRGRWYQYRSPLGHVGRNWDGEAVYRRKSLLRNDLQDIRRRAGTHCRSCKSLSDGDVTDGTHWLQRENRYKERKIIMLDGW